MDALPNIPMELTSGGLSEDCRVLENPFGDGYRQRAGDGMNNIEGAYEAKWENITKAEADTLIAFFRAKGGYLPFTHTPKNETGTWIWTCKKWSRPPDRGPFTNVTATFRREFDLA